MKLLFVILAHDRPEEVVALAAALTEGGSDARALIHFDARAEASSWARLQAEAAGAVRVDLVEDRVATPWGEWGLVQAPLNALAQARRFDDGWRPDRALLLSGACLPCRPVKTLERFFAEAPEQEFIEVAPPTWIQGGLREERYEHWFPFNKQTQHVIHHNFNKLQRLLGIRRQVPEGLTPRFGSQWWALSWATCEALLDHAQAHPDHMRWFRWCWIPDEMAIQTLVGRHVPRRRIAGRNLTHFRFTDHGKPVVYHDDHIDYIRGLDAFLFRKAHPEAQGLRAACLELARAPDDGRAVLRDDRAELDYRLRARALSAYPGPGQPFH
ncbi:MAG: beta-1,6-N-acetylglucosaminyltransferase, partial [Pseudomonadota bacterium]